MFSLEGKTAVVTGAAGELGFASASAMAELGANVVLVDLNSEALEARVEQLPAGTEVHTVTADVTDEADVQRYVREAVDRFGSIDAFHNNAGIEGASAPVWDYAEADFQKVMQVNVVGAFLGLKYVGRVMKEQGSGAIVNSSSVGGLLGAGNGIAYTASKHAVLGMARESAADLAPFGVRVNSIHPGFMDTRMLRALAEQQSGGHTDQAMQQLAKTVPTGRLGKPAEVGAVVAFLMTDETAYIDAASVSIDGGLANLASNAS
ncbi:MAG: SDR family NAD(P)-dependent oxidoreductase [Galactobacter sp.]